MIIGLDVGGTHTDVALLGDEGLLKQAKVPTDSENLLECVRAGLRKVTEGVSPESIRRMVLSTTLTTNAIAENKLAPVGMIVSSGPGLDPEYFRTGEHYYAVSGSIDHRGREIQPVNEMEIEAVGSRLRREGIRRVGVVSKFSTRNPKHETRIQEILGEDFDYILKGHLVSGSLNFPRRIATTYLNAAVHSVYRKFFQAVRTGLKEEGLDIPIYILKADGGTMSLESSLSYPGQTILSGPAASVMGALPFASSENETLVLDIGGTTTDMAVFIRHDPLLEPWGIELGGYKTLIRALRSKPIGLGGDSAVRVEDGRLRLGPDRMGPALAYGGPAPTPTDALVVMGRIAEGDREASRRGLEGIAGELGLSVEETAREIFETACYKILDAAALMIEDINSRPVYTIRELMEGHKVNPSEILVLGGPAPYFAEGLASLSDYDVGVVPQWQVANAIGAALARTTCELTLFVDTERGMAAAPEEEFHQPVKGDFTKEAAVELAGELLRAKALREGADAEDLEVELLEELQFNMVRGFYTTGRNIRVKVQVKPGMIHRYCNMAPTMHEGEKLC